MKKLNGLIAGILIEIHQPSSEISDKCSLRGCNIVTLVPGFYFKNIAVGNVTVVFFIVHSSVSQSFANSF